MNPLTFFRRVETSDGLGNAFRIRFENLGECTLRIVSAQNNSVVNLVSAGIVDRNTISNTDLFLALFHRLEQVEAGREITWEGKIKLGKDQCLVVSFELSHGVPAGATDTCVSSVGVEYG